MCSLYKTFEFFRQEAMELWLSGKKKEMLSLQTNYMWALKFSDENEENAYAALRVGKQDLLFEALDKGFQPQPRLCWGFSPLEMACLNKDSHHLVDLLLDYGANPNHFLTVPPLALMSIHFAFDTENDYNSNYKVVTSLVRAGADPEASGYFSNFGKPLLLGYQIAEAQSLAKEAISPVPKRGLRTAEMSFLMSEETQEEPPRKRQVSAWR